MRAKEYAGKINSEKTPEGKLSAAKGVVRELISELGSIAKTRGVQGNDAFKAVFLEVNQKWESICRQVMDMPLSSKAFKETIKLIDPDVYFTVWGGLPVVPSGSTFRRFGGA